MTADPADDLKELQGEDALALETAIKSVTDLLETKLRVIDRELLALNERRDTLHDLHRQFTSKLNALKGPKVVDRAFVCDEPDCDKVFTSAQGVTVHKNRSHKKVTPKGSPLGVVAIDRDKVLLRCSACPFVCHPSEAPLMAAHVRSSHRRELSRDERTPRTA